MEWRYTEEGERVRVSLRSGRIIPLPLRERRDGIVPEQWIGERGRGGQRGRLVAPGVGHGASAPSPRLRADGPKDTTVKDALEKTYAPSLKTFEEEIMDAMGIVETRRPKKSYWY